LKENRFDQGFFQIVATRNWDFLIVRTIQDQPLFLSHTPGNKPFSTKSYIGIKNGGCTKNMRLLEAKQ